MQAYAIKTAISDPDADIWNFPSQRTMYGGKHVHAGDLIFVFSSDHMGGRGLLARGKVLTSTGVPRREAVLRQTPLVSLTIKRTATARVLLGRSELKPFADWGDGRPQTELNFKLYRQATNKVVGLSHATANWLNRYF